MWYVLQLLKFHLCLRCLCYIRTCMLWPTGKRTTLYYFIMIYWGCEKQYCCFPALCFFQAVEYTVHLQQITPIILHDSLSFTLHTWSGNSKYTFHHHDVHTSSNTVIVQSRADAYSIPPLWPYEWISEGPASAYSSWSYEVEWMLMLNAVKLSKYNKGFVTWCTLERTRKERVEN